MRQRQTLELLPALWCRGARKRAVRTPRRHAAPDPGEAPAKSWRWHNVGRHTGSQANPLQIERQAIADIDGGRGAQFLAQELAQRQPGFGIQMALPACLGLALMSFEAKRRSAQRARNVDLMPGACAAAQQCRAARHGTADGDIASERGRRAPNRRLPESSGCRAAKAVERIEKIIGPAIRWPRRADKPTPGRNAAVPPMAAMSLRLRASAFRATSAALMGLAQEMDAFDEEVGSEKQIVGTAAWPVDGAIVSDSGNDGRRRRDLDKPAQALGDGLSRFASRSLTPGRGTGPFRSSPPLPAIG